MWNRVFTCSRLAFVLPLGVGAFCALRLPFAFGFFPWIRDTYNWMTLGVSAVLAGAAAIETIGRRRERVPIGGGVWACLGIVALLFGTRVYATWIEPNRLVVRSVVIETDKVDERIRVLHVSDIQSARVGAHERRAFRKMRELRADLIIQTGDLLQPRGGRTWESELPKLKALLDTLEPPLGFFGVSGDVDRRLRSMGVETIGPMRLLADESVEIDANGTVIRIHGLTRDLSREPDVGVIRDWLAASSKNDISILIGHAPDYILSVDELDIDLCLAGHTHGGQIRLPGVGPLVTLSRVPREWARGFHEVGETRLNVSAGIGCEHHSGLPPIRVLCPPEMTLIEFRPRGS